MVKVISREKFQSVARKTRKADWNYSAFGLFCGKWAKQIVALTITDVKPFYVGKKQITDKMVNGFLARPKNKILMASNPRKEIVGEDLVFYLDLK
jgi:hypothetical protein